MKFKFISTILFIFFTGKSPFAPPQQKVTSILEIITINKEMEIPFCSEKSLDNKIIFIVSKYCPHCNKSRPVLEEIIKKQNLEKSYSYYDLANEKDGQNLEKYGVKVIYTPTLIINCHAYIGSKSKEEFKKLVLKFKPKTKTERRKK